MYLGGDMLAAQYMLMLLVSRSFAKHGDQALGLFSLNIANWPESISVPQFCQAVAELVPRVTSHEVTADALNAGRWRPRKDFDANRLVAGRLQCASGTVVIFDETKMNPGQLQDAGVRNLAAIRSLMKEQQLVCDFMTCDVKIPVETQVVHISRGKSIIPEHDVLLPLRSAECVQCVIQPAALAAIRLFIALVTRSPKPLKIPDEVTHKFSTDFASLREQQSDVAPELCHTWMTLARACCITHGEEELSLDRWSSILQMESERLQRCRASNFMKQ